MAGYSNNFEGLWSIADHKIKHYSLENQRVALGVSGGADSIGLFHVFSSFLKQKIISDLVVFHINFGLRGEESDQDEAFVRSICSEENVPCRVYQAGLRLDAGIQERAREFRQNIQAKLRDGGFLIALAHNADDVAENVLMRLARGSALDHAAGMAYYDGHVFRPWLDVSRETIRAALRERGIAWRDDSSNIKNLYSRNRIRNEVMPILEDLYAGATLRIARSFLEYDFPTSRHTAVSGDAMNMADLARVARHSLGRVVHDFLMSHYGGRSAVSRQVIDQITAAIHRISTGLDGEVREFQLPDRKLLVVSRPEIRISSRK